MTRRRTARTQFPLVALALLAAIPAAWGPAEPAAARRRGEPQPARNRLKLRAALMPQAPVIDGRLGEDEWAAAASVAVGLDVDSAQPVTENVIWKIAWDANTLYIAASTPLDRPSAAPGAEADGQAYLVSLEGREAAGRLDVRIGPGGVGSATSRLQRFKDPNDEPPPQVQSAVAQRDGQLVMELAVPMSTFAFANRQRGGHTWNVRIVRQYAGAEAISMLCDRGAEPENWPEVKLTDVPRRVHLAIGNGSLKTGRPEFIVRLTAYKKPLEGQVRGDLFRAGQWVGQSLAPIAIDANATGEGSVRPDVDAKLDPQARGESLAIFEVKPDSGRDVLLLQLTWDPARLAGAIPAGQGQWQADPNTPSAGRVEVRHGGRVVHAIEYDRGLRHGDERVYDANGTLRLVVPWQRGIIAGERLVFHDGGQLMMSTPYREGAADGNATRYDQQGRVFRTVGYRRGLRSGDRIDWYVRRPERIAPYREGLLDGVVRDYWDNGNLKMERPFREDILHGIEKHYNPEGKLIDSRYWWNGERVSRRRYQAYAAGAAAE